MGQTTTEVREDIERIRGEMTGTIDAISDRTRPSRVVARQRQRIASGFRGVRDRVMGTYQGAAHSTQQGAGQVMDTMSQAQQRTGEAVGNARQRAGEAVGTAQQRAGEVVTQVPRQAADVIRTQTEGNPLAVGLIAFGAGALAAYLIPPSRTEQRVAAQVRSEAEPALEELKQAGSEVAQGVKETAQQATDEVRSTATESAQHVADEARTATDEVRQQAGTSTENVTRTTQ